MMTLLLLSIPIIRGFKTIEDTFINGLPNATLQHDRFACHFNCNALHHQICMSHLLRDLQYIIELYPKCRMGYRNESID
ncbi:MAG: hypothetical protein WKG06_40865 [Segetibacter sp.]